MKMYLNGQLTTSGEDVDVLCPADGSTAGTIAWAGRPEVERALAAAAAALKTWSTTPVAERTRWMRMLREAVVQDEETLRGLVHMETGKTWAQTAEDHSSLVDSLGYYADQIEALQDQVLPDAAGTHRHRVQYSAVGVVGAFVAWNFPLLNLGFKLGPAMAAGCPIILKPSHKAPLSAYRVGELCAQIGLPAGAVNILCGEDDVIGDGISSSTIPAMLTVIGSTATGRHVMSVGSSSIKRYSMELGGNAPVLVYPDADLERATAVIGDLKFGNAGQTCVAPNRVFVHRDVSARLTALLVARANATRVGFADDDSVDMGPLIDAHARDRVAAMVADATAKGALLLAGGDAPPGADPAGSFFAPTVVGGVVPGMRLHDEEVFGPVVTLIEFSDDSDVLALANDTDAGLASYVFTADAARAQQVAAELEFGEVQINGVKYAIDLPHVGVKQSGIGCDCSPLALHEYLDIKRVSEAVSW